MLLPEKLASGLVPALEMGTLPPDVPWANNQGSSFKVSCSGET